jgi:hypothetical protein
MSRDTCYLLFFVHEHHVIPLTYIYLVHMHPIGVPKEVALLEFEGTGEEEQQQPTPEVQEVQLTGEVPSEVGVDCPDHVSCNFVKGKLWSIIRLLISKI